MIPYQTCHVPVATAHVRTTTCHVSQQRTADAPRRDRGVDWFPWSEGLCLLLSAESAEKGNDDDRFGQKREHLVPSRGALFIGSTVVGLWVQRDVQGGAITALPLDVLVARLGDSRVV